MTDRTALTHNTRHYSRDHDEMVLSWLTDRAAGYSCGQIAAAHGRGRGVVVKATNAVLAHDAEQSGEDVSAHYWCRA